MIFDRFIVFAFKTKSFAIALGFFPSFSTQFWEGPAIVCLFYQLFPKTHVTSAWLILLETTKFVCVKIVP